MRGSPNRGGHHHRSGRTRSPLVIGLVTVAVLAVLGGFVALSALTGEPYSYFSKEPAEILDVPRYIGWAAHVTVLVAFFGAASAVFAGLLVRRRRGPCAESGFLLGIGGFTTLIVLDDLLQLHDWIIPRALPGVGERVVYFCYGVVLVAVLWRWGRKLVLDDVALALLAGGWLGGSLAMDQLADPEWPYYHLVEDGAKLMGLALWTVYLVRTGLTLVAAPPREPVPHPVVPELPVPRPAARKEPSPRPVVDRVPAPRTEINPLPTDDGAGRSRGSPDGPPPRAPQPRNR